MARLDFGSIYKEEKFDYIHSHYKYFSQSMEKRGIDFDTILKDIKTNFIARLREDIEYFKKIEDDLANSMLQKNDNKTFKDFPTPDRKGLLIYLKKLKYIMDQNEDTTATSLIKLKENSILLQKQTQEIVDAYEKLFKSVEVDIPKVRRREGTKKGVIE
jgi:hypothetical protein